jgi:hypothetical protein
VGPRSNQIKAALAKAAPGLPLGALLEGISKAVQDALDVPVADVLIGAWQRARGLRAALETTRESAAATVLARWSLTRSPRSIGRTWTSWWRACRWPASCSR